MIFQVGNYLKRAKTVALRSFMFLLCLELIIWLKGDTSFDSEGFFGPQGQN